MESDNAVYDGDIAKLSRPSISSVCAEDDNVARAVCLDVSVGDQTKDDSSGLASGDDISDDINYQGSSILKHNEDNLENITKTVIQNDVINKNKHKKEVQVLPTEHHRKADDTDNTRKSLTEDCNDTKMSSNENSHDKITELTSNEKIAFDKPHILKGNSPKRDIDRSHNVMPFGLRSNIRQESKESEDDDDTLPNESDSSTDEKEALTEPRVIDLAGFDIPEMMSPKSRIDYINDMRKQLGTLVKKGPSIVATNLLHGVSEPPMGSPKDKLTNDDVWEVLTPSSSVSSSTSELKGATNQKLHGTLTREGEMVSFVADDIMEIIRKSASPMASSRGSPASSMSVASGQDTPRMLSRAESLSRNAIPPIDPAVITDIEKHCKRVADSLDLMLGHLIGSIHNMSAITVGHIQTYKDAADKVGSTVDQSVKAMYSLIAKCEQLDNMMQPVDDLAKQIKGIKKLLDELELKCK
ncbi:uncharacterized protein [Antedon mediterranea]|uniref:uncharacterized protein isoform X1 n=1 Tax=Antedon mediterranea TaxID=105859 RepID=UPI003AF790D3